MNNQPEEYQKNITPFQQIANSLYCNSKVCVGCEKNIASVNKMHLCVCFAPICSDCLEDHANYDNMHKLRCMRIKTTEKIMDHFLNLLDKEKRDNEEYYNTYDEYMKFMFYMQKISQKCDGDYNTMIKIPQGFGLEGHIISGVEECIIKNNNGKETYHCTDSKTGEFMMFSQNILTKDNIEFVKNNFGDIDSPMCELRSHKIYAFIEYLYVVGK